MFKSVPVVKPPPPILHHTRVPGAVDMAGYAPFYQQIIQETVAQRSSNEAPLVVVEAGVRYGCSARIFMETLQEHSNWQLHLIDPVPQKEALALENDSHITFYKQGAQHVASQFPDASIDLLHLDVDCDNTHPYELTFQILLAFWHKLKPDAPVLLHDCTSHFPGILRLANELGASGWTVEHCPPVDQCPIAAPAVARRDGKRLGRGFDTTVVIPVIQDRFLAALLSNIQENDIQPVEIIVIDNSGGAVEWICEGFSNLPIRYLKQAHNIGVNAAWNLGVETAQTELVSILNDDLVLHSCFFRSIQETFATYPRAGFVIPSTVGPPLDSGRQAPWIVGAPDDVQCDEGHPRAVSLDSRSGGWAMTIRKNLWTPIPTSMFTFCGDDFIFKQIKDKGFWTLQVLNNRIYHYVGISFDLKQRARLGLPDISRDQRAWKRLKGPKR